MRRLRVGFQILQEDSSNFGAQEVMRKIVNLDSVVDGLYEVRPCNAQNDWETGLTEDYDYRLIPFKP